MTLITIAMSLELLGVFHVASASPKVPQMGKLGVEAQQTRVVSVPEKLVAHLMTPEHRQMLTEESGADVEWAPDQGKVRLQGFAKQLGVAARLLARVEMHCHWGSSEAFAESMVGPVKTMTVHRVP